MHALRCGQLLCEDRPQFLSLREGDAWVRTLANLTDDVDPPSLVGRDFRQHQFAHLLKNLGLEILFHREDEQMGGVAA